MGDTELGKLSSLRTPAGKIDGDVLCLPQQAETGFSASTSTVVSDRHYAEEPDKRRGLSMLFFSGSAYVFTCELRGADGSLVRPVRKAGTAAEHCAWCLEQAVALLSKGRPGRAASCFVSKMQEREDTYFVIQWRWPLMFESQVRLVWGPMTSQAERIPGVQSCNIVSNPILGTAT